VHISTSIPSSIFIHDHAPHIHELGYHRFESLSTKEHVQRTLHVVVVLLECLDGLLAAEAHSTQLLHTVDVILSRGRRIILRHFPRW
jgi:hypothetical protein